MFFYYVYYVHCYIILQDLKPVVLYMYRYYYFMTIKSVMTFNFVNNYLYIYIQQEVDATFKILGFFGLW